HQSGEPQWVAMEEVPHVLPLWKQYAQILRGWGFSVWTGILNAADYGVPQTRRRAILLASRTRTAAPPPPTHAAVAEPETLFGPGRDRWISMAEALGWGATDRPVPTVCAGGGPRGGAEPFPSGSRKALADARDRGAWAARRNSGLLASGHGSAERHSAPENRATKVPASTSTAEAHRWSWRLRSNNQANATIRSIEEPAGTLFFGHRANECVWEAEAGDGGAVESIRITAAEAGLLQTFPATYPWQGTKGAQFSQIGNAVPPRFAAHLLAPHVGRTFNRDDFALAA
ncbi:DNA cytosine methyltransferase, partial [Streptomyces sp. NPDC003860]